MRHDALMSQDLDGKVALVTGAGRGIGRVFAEALAGAGARVAVAARSADQLEETVALIAASGGRAYAHPLDVADRSGVDAAVQAVEGELGPIDLLVNNAGVWGPLAPMWELDPDEWWDAIRINLLGCFLCSRAVLTGMVSQRSGRIINIGSHAGVFRWPNASAYAISKAAMIKLTENLAAETRKFGVAVFTLNPGIVTIGLTDQAMAMADFPDSPAARAAAWIRAEVAEGRAMPPERGADLLVALASGRADVLSGRYLTVHDDLDAYISRAEEIERDDLYTLRLRESSSGHELR
jgi:NAD(P)-dependent dehydrogenase (short-subunit alcohol dehydrogenase family)